MKTFLKTAQQLGELRLFDLQFAQHLMDVNGKNAKGKEEPALRLAAALASNRLSHGDTCLSLDTVASSSLYKNPELRTVRQKLPPIDKWRKLLLEQKVVTVPPEIAADVSADSDTEISNNNRPNARKQQQAIAPLILDEDNRLYLARYWVLEQSLVSSVNKLLDRKPPEIDTAKLSATLEKLFSASEKSATEGDAIEEPGIDEPDWQKVSVATAVTSNFCVITGGPGTGKTYTVTALLAALIEQGVEPHKIALAAPTGKASTRLTQSIQKDLSGLLGKLDLPDASFESVTLHKLIGARPGRVRPRHDAALPLLYDFVIIDEASMIDLPMMARTFDALADDARIVLIGDKDQLHSVESGMVLGDICGGRTAAELSSHRCKMLSEFGIHGLPECANPGGRVADYIIYLEKSHRVQDAGGISMLANAVNTGDVDAAIELLGNEQSSSLSLVLHESDNLNNVLRQHVVPACQQYSSAESPLSALKAMADIGVLCALRHGPTGAVKINDLVERLLLEIQAIEQGQNYYHGKPLMIVENSSHQGLFNGDHGLVLIDKSNKTSVFFASDSSDDGVRTISPTRLPQHETFYAMTVHKSQGSEYSTVIVVLPSEDSPILSRELLYTAITRARNKVIVVANEAQLKTCITKRSERQSGLREMFWTAPHTEVPDGGLPNAKPVEAATAAAKKGKPSPPIQQTLDF